MWCVTRSADLAHVQYNSKLFHYPPKEALIFERKTLLVVIQTKMLTNIRTMISVSKKTKLLQLIINVNYIKKRFVASQRRTKSEKLQICSTRCAFVTWLSCFLASIWHCFDLIMAVFALDLALGRHKSSIKQSMKITVTKSAPRHVFPPFMYQLSYHCCRGLSTLPWKPHANLKGFF